TRKVFSCIDWVASSALTTRRISADARATRRLSGNVRQPDRVLANEIVAHKAERRPGAGEEGLAATQHEGTEVESILVNKTKVGQASRELRSGNFDLPNSLSLEPTYHRRDVILDKCGVGSDRL